MKFSVQVAGAGVCTSFQVAALVLNCPDLWLITASDSESSRIVYRSGTLDRVIIVICKLDMDSEQHCKLIVYGSDGFKLLVGASASGKGCMRMRPWQSLRLT